jgi:hypothetical protein
MSTPFTPTFLPGADGTGFGLDAGAHDANLAHVSAAADARTAAGGSSALGGYVAGAAAAAAAAAAGAAPGSWALPPFPSPPTEPSFLPAGFPAAAAPRAHREAASGLPALAPPPSVADAVAQPGYLERTSPFRELLLYPTHGGEKRGPLERSIVRWVADAWNAAATPVQYGKIVGAVRLGIHHIHTPGEAKRYLEQHLQLLYRALRDTEGPQASAFMRFLEGPIRAIFVAHCLGVPMGSESGTRPLAPCDARLRQLAADEAGGSGTLPAPYPCDMDALYAVLRECSGRALWAPWTPPPSGHRARQARGRAAARK